VADDDDIDDLEDKQAVLSERLAHLEGVMETEDKVIEHRVESVKNGLMMLIGISAIVVAAAVALLVYILQRLDAIQAAHR
jgi:hypothetical protein